MFRKSIFSRLWNLTLVFPPHFDVNGSDIKHILAGKKNSKKESEKLCKIVDSRSYPASVRESSFNMTRGGG